MIRLAMKKYAWGVTMVSNYRVPLFRKWQLWPWFLLHASGCLRVLRFLDCHTTIGRDFFLFCTWLFSQVSCHVSSPALYYQIYTEFNLYLKLEPSGVCHNHLKHPGKNWRTPASPRDNTCQSLGLIFPCYKVLMVDPVLQ